MCRDLPRCGSVVLRWCSVVDVLSLLGLYWPVLTSADACRPVWILAGCLSTGCRSLSTVDAWWILIGQPAPSRRPAPLCRGQMARMATPLGGRCGGKPPTAHRPARGVRRHCAGHVSRRIGCTERARQGGCRRLETPHLPMTVRANLLP